MSKLRLTEARYPESGFEHQPLDSKLVLTMEHLVCRLAESNCKAHCSYWLLAASSTFGHMQRQPSHTRVLQVAEDSIHSDETMQACESCLLSGRGHNASRGQNKTESWYWC